MKDHEVILTFGIWDFSEIDHAYITNLMGFEPNIIYRLGERRIPNKGQPSKRNGWLWRPEVVDKTLLDSFELQLNSILGKFENKIAELKQIEKYCFFEIRCGLFLYSGNGKSTPIVHFDKRYNDFVREINVEFDFDIYV